MAGALSITCAMTTLEVEHGAYRECPFTLCNRAAGELRLQLRVLALDATAQGWLALRPADTIELSPGETRQVAVGVQPQACGRFSFRLDAIPIATAGERAIGPSVDLVVARRDAPGAPRRTLPGLAVAVLLALVLLALAFALAPLLVRATPAPPAPPAAPPHAGLGPGPACAAVASVRTVATVTVTVTVTAAPTIPDRRPSSRSEPCPMN